MSFKHPFFILDWMIGSQVEFANVVAKRGTEGLVDTSVEVTVPSAKHFFI